MLRRRAVHLIASLAVLFTAFALAPGTAQAATGWNRCPSGYFCIFADTGGNGTYGYLQYADGNLGDSNGVQGMNNTTESVWNRTGNTWGVANDPGYGCPCQLFGSGFKGAVDSSVKNKVSSLCRTAGGGSTTCT